MSARVSAPQSRSFWFALAVSLVACGGTKTAADAGGPPGQDAGPDAGEDAGLDAGVDAGVDAGALSCASIGAPCTVVPGCGNLVCAGGVWSTPAPICAGYAEPCSAQVHCCAPPDAGNGTLSCTALDAGLSVCATSYFGGACKQDSDCGEPFGCVSGSCGFPLTNAVCSGTNCRPGDSCSSTFSGPSTEYNTRQATAADDPCFASGLICYLVNSTQTSVDARCLTTTVMLPPAFPFPDGPPFDWSVCNSNFNSCVPDPLSAPRADAICGGYFLDNFGNGHCFDACKTGEDCASVADDCVAGTCQQSYCFVAGPYVSDGGPETFATYLTPFALQAGQLAPASDPSVLFHPCPLDAGYPTACLPQLDSSLNVSSGICVRIGAKSSGGVGALCDPQPYRNNPAGLCAPGSYCDQGTCLPWCDLGSTAYVQCPAGTACNPLPPGGPLNSTPTGITNSLGVCTTGCDPYQPASNNHCPFFPSDAGSPPPVCKFSGGNNDIHPVPGVCLAGVENPIAVGQACVPFGWVDPCVSGAQCLNSGDGGTAFACAQLCDPSPSPGVNVPACPNGTSCQAFTSCNGSCEHEGACQ